MLKKKLMVAALATSLVGSALVGCGSKAPAEVPGEKVQLEFWTWWGSEARRPIIETMVDEFNKSQDAIEVTHVFLPWGDIFTKNIASIAAGNPTDIIVNQLSDVKFRAGEGQIESLSKFINDDSEFNTDIFYSQYIDAVTDEDGNVYALPFLGDTRLIYYNKDHFAEVGIDPESQIGTRTEFQEVAYKLDKKNADGKFERVGFHPLLGNGDIDTWSTNANSGSQWYNEETGEMVINTPENVETINWINSFTEHYSSKVIDELMAAYSSGMQDPFLSGQVSMMIQTNSYKGVIAKNAPDFNYGVILLPQYKEGSGNWTNGSGFVLEVPKGAKNPEASYEFIKFMTGPWAQKYWAQNVGELSVRKDFAEDEEMMADPVYAKSMEALEFTNIGLLPNEWTGFRDYLNPSIDEALLRKISAEEALQKSEKAVQDYIGKK